jgi:hypothetical protein
VIEPVGDAVADPLVDSAAPMIAMAAASTIEVGSAPLGARNVGDFLGDGGTIVLSEQPPAPIAVDDLFSKGGFTDYGVALTAGEGDVPAAGPALDPALKDVGLITDGEIHGGHEAGDSDHLVQQAPVVAELPGALDELALRGGDVI